ncbi:MAG: hypothetical protein GF401_09090 [Chitinivibrionales bacterium]|nr:hypothetical protein [Chitinivibrionales bacterium]
MSMNLLHRMKIVRPSSPTDRTNNGGSSAHLFADLRNQMATLAGLEKTLAKREIKDQLITALKGVGLIAAGAVTSFAGVIVLLIGIAAALSLILDNMAIPRKHIQWLSFITTGGLGLLGAAACVVAAALTLRRLRAGLPRTIQTIKETASWAGEVAHPKKD